MATKFVWNGRQVEEAVGKAAASALTDAAEHILEEANRTVPIDEGVALMRSGEVDVDSDALVASVSYGGEASAYAVVQHEKLTLRHKPGRRAKWLEKTLDERAEAVQQYIAEKLREAMRSDAMPIVGVAQYLANLGLVTISGPNTDCFLGAMPDGGTVPHEAVAITPYGGPGSDPKYGYDTVMFQVHVRGPTTGDAVAPHRRSMDIYDALHGLINMELPNGVWVVSILGLQSSPQWLERDERNRVHYVLNYQMEVRSITTHRV